MCYGCGPVNFVLWISTKNNNCCFYSLDCLRRLSKGTADFTILTPEDLVTAHTSEIEVLLTNELRYTDGISKIIIEREMCT